METMQSDLIVQGSPEWFAQRRGLFTGSEIYKICKPKGLGQGGETYIKKKVAELITLPEYDTPEISTMATRWGNDNEELLFHVHGKKSKGIIEECGFMVHPELKYLGASPDRFVHRNGTVGIGEGKCPFEPENHIDHCLIDSVEYFKKNFDQYYWQCVCEYACTPETTFVDFISFDPRMSRKHGYFCFTFTPPDEDIEFLLTRAKEARKLMESICTKLNVTI